MIKYGVYSIDYKKDENRIIINLPQTAETITNTTEAVSNRRVDVDNVELITILRKAITTFERETNPPTLEELSDIEPYIKKFRENCKGCKFLVNNKMINMSNPFRWYCKQNGTWQLYYTYCPHNFKRKEEKEK